MQSQVLLVSPAFTTSDQSEAVFGSRSILVERGLLCSTLRAWVQSEQLLLHLPTRTSFMSGLAKLTCAIRFHSGMECTSPLTLARPGNILDWRTHDRLVASLSIQRTLIWFTWPCWVTYTDRIRIVVFTEPKMAVLRGRRSCTRKTTWGRLISRLILSIRKSFTPACGMFVGHPGSFMRLRTVPALESSSLLMAVTPGLN